MKVQHGADVYLSPTGGIGRESVERECFQRGSQRSAWGGHGEVSGRMCQVPSSYSLRAGLSSSQLPMAMSVGHILPTMLHS